MTTELKPCPFCGGEARFYHDHPVYENRMFIGCTECNAEVEPLDNIKHSKSDQIVLWNTRAVPDVPELVRYGISMFGNGAVEMGEGEYVRYDQVAAIIAAERQSAVAAEADNKRLREALTKISKGSYDGLEVANLSKKHMKDIARAALEGSKK